jgi:hypothetical protein
LLVAKIADAVLEGKAQRKEDEPEQSEDAKSDGKPKVRGPRKPIVETEQDENMGEDALLGASTLAKLNVTRKADETPVAVETPVVADAPAASDEAPAKAE